VYRFSLAESFGVYKWSIDFEHFHKDSVMYTNVTGGDWKNIKNPKTGQTLHIHKLEEERADLIVYLEKFQIILVTEAKDVLRKLYNDLEKHVNVINGLNPVLRRKSDNWSQNNATSLIIPTLLWCSDKKRQSIEDVDQLFQQFADVMKNKLIDFSNTMIGLEVVRDEKMSLSSNSIIYHNNQNKSLINDLSKELHSISRTECRVNNNINF